VTAFAVATAASGLIFVAVFAVLSALAGVGLGWLTALAGSVKIINWLTVPTAASNLINALGGLLFPVNFYAVLDVARITGVAVIAISLPLLWWRFRHTVVLHLAAGGGRRAVAVAAGDRGDRGPFDVDHRDLEARRGARYVLMDSRAARHRMRCGGVVFAVD
jgi:hypothetical protein